MFFSALTVSIYINWSVISLRVMKGLRALKTFETPCFKWVAACSLANNSALLPIRCAGLVSYERVWNKQPVSNQMYIFAPFMHTPHQLSHIVCEHNPRTPPNTLSPRFFPISLISVGNECSVLWGLCGRRAWGSYPQNLILLSLSASPQCPGVSWGGRSHLKRKLSFVILTKRDGEREREWGGEMELLRRGRKIASFLLQPVNRLMGAGAGMSWYLSAPRERETDGERDTHRMTIWWLPNSFFLLGPISWYVRIYLFIYFFCCGK